MGVGCGVCNCKNVSRIYNCEFYTLLKCTSWTSFGPHGTIPSPTNSTADEKQLKWISSSWQQELSVCLPSLQTFLGLQLDDDGLGVSLLLGVANADSHVG
jgi:hypothetical protein